MNRELVSRSHYPEVNTHTPKMVAKELLRVCNPLLPGPTEGQGHDTDTILTRHCDKIKVTLQTTYVGEQCQPLMPLQLSWEIGNPRVRLVSRLSYFVLFWSNLGVMREKPVAHAAQR